MKGDEKLAKVEAALPLISRPEEKRSAIAVVQSVARGMARSDVVQICRRLRTNR